MWVVDRVHPAAQRRRQCPRGVQRVGPPHRRAEPEEEILLVPGDLLHVRTLILGRLVTKQVPYTQYI